jgi:hypothetical protein
MIFFVGFTMICFLKNLICADACLFQNAKTFNIERSCINVYTTYFAISFFTP